MNLVLGLLVAVVVGVLWVLLMRRAAARRRLISAPKDVASVLDAYRRGRWGQVTAEAELDPLELFDHVYGRERAALLEQRARLEAELADAAMHAADHAGAAR